MPTPHIHLLHTPTYTHSTPHTPLTILSQGLSNRDASSNSSEYSSSSHSRCRALRGSLRETGMEILDKSLPIFLRSMPHKLRSPESKRGRTHHKYTKIGTIQCASDITSISYLLLVLDKVDEHVS